MISDLKRLGTIRKLSGLTQTELANKLGVSQPYVARLEKEAENGSASVKQTEDWLHGCGFPSATSSHYFGELIKLLSPQQKQVHGFLIALDEMMRSAGFLPHTHAKPTVVVMPNTQDDHDLSIRILRNLLDDGRAFHGLLLPPRGLTIAFKHVSDRPSKEEDTAYVLDGWLNKEMLPSPLDYLKDPLMRGSLQALESPGEKSTGVVYLEHPLLRSVNVVRPGMNPEDPQQVYFDLDTIADAELIIYCCGATRARLSSPALFVSACLATRAEVIVAHRTGVDPSHYLGMIEDAGRKVLGRMILGDDHGLERNNLDVLKAFVAAVRQLDIESSAERRWALTNGDDLRVHKRQRPPISRTLRTKTKLGEMIIARLLSGAAEEEDGDIFAGTDILRTLAKFTRGEINWNLPVKELSSRSKEVDREVIANNRRQCENTAPQFVEIAHLGWKQVSSQKF